MPFRVISSISFIMLLSIVPMSLQAQKTSTFITDSLESYVQRNMKEFRIPGLAICIVKDGKIIALKTFGTKKITEQDPITPTTLFPIASITKTLTGTAMAMLEAEKKLSLDDKLTQWVPYFSTKDTLYQKQITLTDILSHRSGWKTFQGDLLNTESSMTTKEMLEKFSALQPPYPLRTRFGYSNFGFLLAEECFKPSSGLTWQEFLLERILKPLRMTRTFVQARDIEKDSNIAVGHTLVNDSVSAVPKEKIEPRGYGGMFASISDMGTWMTALLNNGVYEGKQVIQQSVIDRMWRSYTIIGKGKAADQRLYLKTYGLGWEIIQYRGQELIGHNGAYSGVLTKICMIPSERIGIAVLTNSDAHLFHELLSWQIIDAFLNVSAPDYADEFFKKRKERKKNKAEGAVKSGNEAKKVDNTTNNNPLDGSVLAGVYSCDSYGKAFITQTGNSTILRLEYHPAIQGVLTVLDNRHLSCKYNHPMFGTVEFPIKTENGKVQGFTLFVDAFIEADGYEFRKVE